VNIGTVPPPVVYLLCAGLGFLADLLLPPLHVPSWLRVAGAVAIVASFIVVLFVLRRFHTLKTPFDVRKAPMGLVTSGPFRVSRNPSYVALTMLYVGIGLLVGSFGMLLLTPIPVAVLNRWVIPLEEARLKDAFGDAYLDYMQCVRRWI
jgi:protein-S-isoprenylcysteine O-methyltransferase Ste14